MSLRDVLLVLIDKSYLSLNLSSLSDLNGVFLLSKCKFLNITVLCTLYTYKMCYGVLDHMTSP